jgi:hypothetical protein
MDDTARRGFQRERRTEVCITVDVEFSIAGALTYPDRCRPVSDPPVYGRIGAREHGLGFLLDRLADHALRATFFVECLNPSYFGDAPMGHVVERLLIARQDVQMHLHPEWLYFRDARWRETVATMMPRPNGSCAGRSVGQLIEFMRLGQATLERWGAPAPVALRTGSFHVDRAVYRAMAAVGLRLGSNVGLAMYRARDPELRRRGGLHWIDGVLEAPVLTYTERVGPWRRPRLLSPLSTSWREMRALLWAARRADVSPVVLITHPFEFIKSADVQFTRIARNRIVQRRFAALCRFLADNAEDFVAVPIGGAGRVWLASTTMPEPDLAPPPLAIMGRMIENGLADRVWAL